jgi:voltage-gated potassium channel
MTSTKRRGLASLGQKVQGAPRANLIERRMSKFLREPPSVRIAASVIVTATALVVIGSGILMRVLDHKEYSNVWVGMWWALQTVTTVGYGDVTPKTPEGKGIAIAVMLVGIGFATLVIGAAAERFIHPRRSDPQLDEDELLAELREILGRLQRVEQALEQRPRAHQPAAHEASSDP